MSPWVAPTPYNPTDPQSWAPMYQDYAQRVVDILQKQGYDVSLGVTPGTEGPYANSPVTPLQTYNLKLGEYSNLLAPQMGVSPEEAAKQFLVNQSLSSLPGGALAPGGSVAVPGATSAGVEPTRRAADTTRAAPAATGANLPDTRMPGTLFSSPQAVGTGSEGAYFSTPAGGRTINTNPRVQPNLGLTDPTRTGANILTNTQGLAVNQPTTTPTGTLRQQVISSEAAPAPGSYDSVAQALGFYTSTPTGTPTVSNIDQWLANMTNNTGWLTNLLEAAGYPTDATAAWQAMKEAAERSTQEQAANLAELFNVAGGRFSTSFGNAMTDFYNQANKDWNATLAQMVYQSQEAARQRELAAGSTLANLGFQGASQLSAQNFQALMQQYQQALAAAQLMASGADTAAQQLAAQGLQGANATLNAAMQAALGLYGTEYGAAGQMYNLQNSLLPLLLQSGISGQTSLGNLLNQWLTTGNQIGTTQYGISQEQLNNLYQEWLRTQPEYSPLLQYLYSAATGYPATYSMGYAPSQFGQTLGGIGSIMGSLRSFLQLFGIGI